MGQVKGDVQTNLFKLLSLHCYQSENAKTWQMTHKTDYKELKRVIC